MDHRRVRLGAAAPGPPRSCALPPRAYFFELGACWEASSARLTIISARSISKLEVFHVGWRHDLRGTENNFCLRSNLIVAEAAGLEGFAFLSGDLALSEQLRAVISQIAEVFDIPPNILHRAVLYIFLDQGCGRQARQFDLAQATRLLHRASGSREADAGGNNDALESWESLDERQRLLLIDLLAFLSVGYLNQLHLGELRLLHPILHEVDPGVLVRRRRRRGENGKIAFVADHLAHTLQHHLGPGCRLWLV